LSEIHCSRFQVQGFKVQRFKVSRFRGSRFRGSKVPGLKVQGSKDQKFKGSGFWVQGPEVPFFVLRAMQGKHGSKVQVSKFNGYIRSIQRILS